MIDIFFYSIAGKKSNSTVDNLIMDLIDLPYIPAQAVKLLKHTQKVAVEGAYPVKQYYKTFYDDPGVVQSSLPELVTYVKAVKDFYLRQDLTGKMISTINDANSTEELVEGLEEILRQDSVNDKSSELADKFKAQTYTDAIAMPHTEGYLIGVPEIDQLTNGCQPGTVGSINAFTGEGKSTLMVSFLYKNAYAGKKCVLFSLEMSPEILWLQFQARYLNEVKGMQITAQDLVFKRLTDEKAKEVAKHDEDFYNDIVSNLMIVDESILNKKIITDARHMTKLFHELESVLGRIDITGWDHVGQLELMYPDCGNIAVRVITSVTKTFRNTEGMHPFAMLAVQTNREGRKRAARREGVYDLQAISDLNEVERSCVYCIFMFTSDDSKIIQETKISMLKHRLGSVLPDPAIVTFNPSILTVGTNIDNITASLDDYSDILGEDDAFDDF